jgi:hypothetical protein
MASYSLNDSAVEHARRLIEGRQYVLESDWGEVQPSADDENAFLEARYACHYRAAEWHHKDVELAAHELLQLLDSTSA